MLLLAQMVVKIVNDELVKILGNEVSPINLSTKPPAVIMFVDLDGFKSVNDNFGHDAGDQVLIESGKRLVEQIRAVDTVGRIGGDEFIILMSDISSIADAESVAAKIISAMDESFVITDIRDKSQSVQISSSIGISLLDIEGPFKDAEQLLREADHAMYKVKRSGKRGYHFAR